MHSFDRTSYLKRALLAVALVCAIFAGATRPASAFLDKTRFLAHLGVAYFAFHHWVLKPYEAGDFAQGAPHRLATMAKGGLALLFAVHEIHVSEKIAQHSKDPLLQKLNAGLGSLTSSFESVGQRLKSGTAAAQDINSLQGQTNQLNSTATAAGAPIKDVPAAIPGT
jgi:hypothetical protein